MTRLNQTLVFILFISLIFGCSPDKKVINIGFIGPLSHRATDLGIGPANAMKLAVEQYNASRLSGQPLVNLFVEDDQWEATNALPLYQKLRKEHQIDILFISNTDGTVAVQDEIEKDQVILINPLNSDSLLSSLNNYSFKVAKSTEEANGLIAIRIIELGFKKVLILHYPNDYMGRAARSVKALLERVNVENKIIKTDLNQTDFTTQLKSAKAEKYDAYVFFGYKEYGYAMKQARELGIEDQFFGSTVLLDPEFYDNSDGHIVGTECSFFTPADGNYVLAREFLKSYKDAFGSDPISIWPPMQAYDAMNLVLNEVKSVNESVKNKGSFGEWLQIQLFRVRFYQGVTGNLSITENGASKGIYFSLYQYASKGNLQKVKR